MTINYISIIIAAAKKAQVSTAIMLALCTHESGLQNVKVHEDGGSPTFGICQIKLNTAKMLGYIGKDEGLMDPKTNAKWASLYLRWQLDRYEGNYCKAVAAYNMGTYDESKKKPGYPKNLKYVKSVQSKLTEESLNELSCDKHLKKEEWYYAENNESGRGVQSTQQKGD